MNNKFKRAVSSILAFVMLLSCVTVMNVSSVWAATNTYEYIPNNPVVNTNNYFNATSDYNTNPLETPVIATIDGKEVTISRGLKLNSGGSVTFSVTGTATVTVMWSAKNADQKCGIGLDGTEKDTATTTDGVKTVVVENVEAGTHTIARTISKEAILYYIRVDDTVSDSAKTYSITGTTDLTSGDTFNLDGKEVTVGANGSFTYSVTAETAPFGEGSTLAVTKDQYGVSPSTVTLSAGADDTSFVVSDTISFTKKELTALAANTYTAANISAGLPNFELSASGYDTSNGRVSNGGYIAFIIDKPAVVTVNAKIATSSDGKSADLLYNTTNSTDGAGYICYLKSGDSTNRDYSVELPAGTYYLIGRSPSQYVDESGVDYSTTYSGTTAVQISSIKIDYDAAATIEVTPTYTIDGTSLATGTVKIDGTEYTVGAAIGDFLEGEYPVIYEDSATGKVYSGTLTVSADNATPTVVLTVIDKMTLTGNIYMQDGATVPSDITITYTGTNGEGAYPVTPSNGSYSIELPLGTYSVEATTVSGYTLSSLSVDNFTVTADADENFNHILYKKNAVAATAKDVYVSANASGDNQYKTITEAIAGIKASSLSASSSDKWIVHIAPGTYREQVIVDVNYVTFVCDSDGDLTDNETGATITWYYGVGYKYYSIKPNASDSVSYARGYYDVEYAYDKHSKATADRWACTVRVTGTDFLAENIDFDASFNRAYLADIETADGVEPAMKSEYGGTGDVVELPVRTAANFATAEATERAAALVLDGARAELYKCSMKSSQDTLYIGTGLAYFNNCIIQGETDYIFGDASTSVFDDCTLVWAGYTEGAKAGFITAARGNMLFRNCTISGATDVSGASVVAGYLGRHWGDNAKVIFADTKGIDDTNLIVASTATTQVAGFQNPSSLTKTYVDAESGNVREGYCTTDAVYSGTEYTEASNVLTSVGTRDDFEILAEDVQGPTYLGAWTPVHYPFAAIAGAPKMYGFDFTTGATVSGSVDVTSTGGDASITLDATGGSISYHSVDHGYNFKPGSAIKFTVGSEGTENIDVTLTFKVTANSTDVAVYNVKDLTTAVSETVALSSTDGTVTFTATPGETYALVVGGSNDFYSPTLTITTTGTISAVPHATSITWGESQLSEANVQNGTSAIFKSDTTGICMWVDAPTGADTKFIDNNGGWRQINAGTVMRVPVFEEGDTIAILSYSEAKFNVTVSVPTASGSNYIYTYTATATDAEAGYVDISPTSNGYVGTITLSTYATIPTAVTSVFAYGNSITGNDVVYVIGTVAEANLAKADEVGFVAGLTSASAALQLLNTSTVATKVIDNSVVLQDAVEGSCFAAATISGVTGDFVVIPYTKVGNMYAFGDATTVAYSANA